MNNINLTGRLTAKPEVKEAGKAKVCRFTLAVDRSRLNKEGKREADFIPCVAWNGTAEFLERNFVKGQAIELQGELRVDAYTAKDGTNRKSYEVYASRIGFAGPKPKAPSEPAPVVPTDDDLAALDAAYERDMLDEALPDFE